jgi:hypothetical protein
LYWLSLKRIGFRLFLGISLKLGGFGPQRDNQGAICAAYKQGNRPIGIQTLGKRLKLLYARHIAIANPHNHIPNPNSGPGSSAFA